MKEGVNFIDIIYAKYNKFKENKIMKIMKNLWKLINQIIDCKI